MNKEQISYMKSLFKPTANKSNSRKVWSIDLETVWLPFFTASNVTGISAIPNDALGAPLRLAYNQDGSVKFSKSGKPTIKVAKDISDNVKLARIAYMNGLKDYTEQVKKLNPEEYKAQENKALEAGKPIKDRDTDKLNEAKENQILEALEHAENAENANVPNNNKELVPA